jgi:hypothetical protein
MLDTRPTVSPVFVDPTGRRRRTVKIAAIAGAVALLGTVGLLVAALLGAPLAPLPFLPDRVSGPPPAVEQQPGGAPAGAENQSAQPSSSRRNRPAGQPTIATTTTPVPAGQTTTTDPHGKPTAPPGKPTDLPTPPGRTR